MIGKIVLRQILLRWVLIFGKLLCHIGQIVAHTCHRCRTAPGIKPRTRHDVKAAFIRLILRRQRNILCDRVVCECCQFVPVHQTCIHIQKCQPIILCRSLCIIMRTVLPDSMGHLMSEHSSKLVHITAQPPNQTAIDAHIVRRVTGSIEHRTVIHGPYEGQRIRAQHIVPILDQPIHNTIDERYVIGIACTAVFCKILPAALYLCMDIIAERKHRAERGMIRTKHAQCLCRNAPRINCLCTRQREK